MSGRAPLVICTAFLAIAIAFGGGGSPAPYPEMVVEIAALSALAWCAFRSPDPQIRHWPVDRRLWSCVALFAAIPLLQLVPLPPAVWHSLPGRGSEASALALIGGDGTWRPISVSPYLTFSSALSLIPPTAMIFLVARLSVPQRTKLLGALAIFGIIVGFIGLLQLVSGRSDWLRFYKYTHYGFATGFQANRNADGDVLLVCGLAASAFAVLRCDILQSFVGKAVLAFTALYFCVSIVVTGSRMATALILVVALAMLMFLSLRTKLSGKLLASIGFCFIVGGALVGSIALNNAVIQKSALRYEATTESRPKIWHDAIFAFSQYSPIGSGVGTFVPVFEAAESLEAVDSTAPNRAHNDYLEYAIEAGIGGILILALFAVAIIVRIAVIVKRAPRSDRAIHAIFAGFLAIVLGLHSLVDYPIRSMSLAVLAGMALGMISGRQPTRGEPNVRE